MNETFHFARNDLINEYRAVASPHFISTSKSWIQEEEMANNLGSKYLLLYLKKKVQLQTYKIFFLKFAWRMTSSKKTND